MDKTKKGRIAGNLIVLIVSVFVSLLLAEVVLRKISPVDTDTSFRYRIPDPILGWVLKPNLDYVEKISGIPLRLSASDRFIPAPIIRNSTGWSGYTMSRV
jgi:hypothetical protein